MDRGGLQRFRTYVYVKESGTYRVEQIGTLADVVLIDGVFTHEKIELTQGWHSLLVEYANTCKIEYKSQTGAYHDDRPRGAVVLLPEKVAKPIKPSAYSDEISMCWAKTEHLFFDPYQGKYNRWNYRFQSVPGLQEMDFAIRGKDLKVWVDGKALPDSVPRKV